MADLSADKLQRRRANGIRRVDYLETGLRHKTERLSSTNRFCTYGPVSSSRRHLNTVANWVILVIFSASGGAAAAILHHCAGK